MQEAADAVGVNRSTLRNWVLMFSDIPPQSTQCTSAEAELQQLRKEVANLRMERDILKKSYRFLCIGGDTMKRFQFIEKYNNGHL